MSKKTIIIFASAALLSFAAAFGASFFFLAPASPETAADEGLAEAAAVESAEVSDEPVLNSAGRSFSISDQKLKDLAYDLRQKKKEYQQKLDSLETEQKRLEQLKELLAADIEKLEALRISLAESANRVRAERDNLLSSRIEISQLERQNLISIAASYDKMDSASAGRILASMSRSKNESVNDAVKILYYMGDRSKAKVLASLADSEPSLAAHLSQQLKTLTEVQ